jgi:hypothetical protein
MLEPSRDRIRRLTVAVVLIGLLFCAGRASADHDGNLHLGLTGPASEPLPPLLRQHVPGLAEGLGTLPPFLRDTELALHFRTLYFNIAGAPTPSEAWALGGRLAYRSGWLADVFRVGATGYTSQPLYAPEGRDGTLLLGPDQSALLVVGQAYGQLRYDTYALLTGYRQLVNQGYTNPHDDRMIPQTFEGATLAGTLGPVDYFLGYLTAMKPRDSDVFINMAARAGVARHNRGQLLTSATVSPLPGLGVYLSNALVPDVFNTAYANAEYKFTLDEAWSGELGLQLTDQRSAGEQLLGRFSTWNVSASAQAHWRGASLVAVMSATGPGAAIQTPYGAWPGYLHMTVLDFDRANEKAWGVGVGYYGGGGLLPGIRIPSLSMLLLYAQGDDAHDPATRARLPLRREGQIDIIWRSRSIRGLQYRFRNGYADVGGPNIVKEFRIYLDYQLPLL